MKKEGLNRAIKLAEELVESVGHDLAAWIVLECERRYWQGKNRAGQIQYSRQQRLGYGWANHDHHTFRSSRLHFSKLVRLFEILGFHCRERFYAGEEAGWGAQVMDHAGMPPCSLFGCGLSCRRIGDRFCASAFAGATEIGNNRPLVRLAWRFDPQSRYAPSRSPISF